MSYLRIGEKGEYISIPEGSGYYYPSKRGVEDCPGHTWEFGEFAQLMYQIAEEIAEDNIERLKMRRAIEDEFAGVDVGFNPRTEAEDLPPREKAEIFCQVLDQRSDFDFTHDVHRRIASWTLDQVEE